jgi:restriction system protein
MELGSDQMTASKPTEQHDVQPSGRFGKADFERMLAEHYRERGWQVEYCGGADAHGLDRGVDLKLRRQDDYVLVHCKYWNALEAPQAALQQTIAAMTAETASGAILTCGGEFSPEIKIAAQRHGRLRLIDGAALREMLGALPESARNRATFKAGSPPLPSSSSASTPARVTASTARASARAVRISSPMQIGGGVLFLAMLIAAAIFAYSIMVQIPSPTLVAPPVASTIPTTASTPAPPAVTDALSQQTPPPKPTIEVPGAADEAMGEAVLPQTLPNPDVEAQEAQDKAEDAMKVIEQSTPEI